MEHTQYLLSTECTQVGGDRQPLKGYSHRDSNKKLLNEVAIKPNKRPANDYGKARTKYGKNNTSGKQSNLKSRARAEHTTKKNRKNLKIEKKRKETHLQMRSLRQKKDRMEMCSSTHL